MSLLPHTIKKYRISNTNTTYTLKHSCDTHYLSQNLKNERIYTLELRDSSLYIKDKESNKDIALMLTKEIPNMQEKQILLDSKDLQTLQTTLELHTHKDIREVYVEVERAKRPKWENMKKTYQAINELSVPERYKLVGGEPLKIYSPDNIHTENTCAMQISYILNKNGVFLENYVFLPKTRLLSSFNGAPILEGSDKHIYLIRVENIIELLLLEEVWGGSRFTKNNRIQNWKMKVSFIMNY